MSYEPEETTPCFRVEAVAVSRTLSFYLPSDLRLAVILRISCASKYLLQYLTIPLQNRVFEPIVDKTSPATNPHWDPRRDLSLHFLFGTRSSLTNWSSPFAAAAGALAEHGTHPRITLRN
jgi:hypothetical protein